MWSSPKTGIKGYQKLYAGLEVAAAVGSADEKNIIPSFQFQSTRTLHARQVRGDIIPIINIWLTNGWSCCARVVTVKHTTD